MVPHAYMYPIIEAVKGSNVEIGAQSVRVGFCLGLGLLAEGLGLGAGGWGLRVVLSRKDVVSGDIVLHTMSISCRRAPLPGPGCLSNGSQR